MPREQDPEQMIRKLADKVSTTGGADTASPGPQEPGYAPVALPQWSNAEFGAPVAFLRSALFGVVKRGPRPSLIDKEIASWPDLSVTYTGQRLDQADLDVWLMIVQLHKGNELKGLGDIVRFRQNPFLRAIHRSTKGGKNKQWLKDSIKRLRAGVAFAESKKQAYPVGNLINYYDIDKETGHILVKVNPNMAKLYEYGWTKVSIEERLSLGEAQLHKALYGFVLSHTSGPDNPLRVGHELLTSIFGESYERRRRFIEKARKALDDLDRQNLIRTWREKDQVFEIVK